MPRRMKEPGEQVGSFMSSTAAAVSSFALLRAYSRESGISQRLFSYATGIDLGARGHFN